MEENRETLEPSIPILFLVLLVLAILRPFFPGSPSDAFGLVEAADALIAAGSLALCALVALSKNKQLKIPAATGLAIFLAATLISAIVGQDRFASAARILSLVGNLGLAVSAASLIRDDDNRRELAGAMTFAIILVLLYGLYQKFWGFNLDAGTGSPSDHLFVEDRAAAFAVDMNRVFSIAFNPGVFAGFLAMAAFVCWGFFKSSKGFIGKALGFVAAILCVIEIFPTSSVGGLWAVGVGLACYVFATGADRIKAARWAAAILLASTTAASIFAYRQIDDVPGGAKTQSVARNEIEIWKGGLKGAIGRPLIIGVGPANFVNPYLKNKSETGPITRYAHSQWLETLVETGVVGLAGFALIVFFLFKGAFEKMRSGVRSDGDTKLLAGMTAGAAAFVAHGCVGFGFDVPGVAAYFWIIAGVLAGGEKVFAWEVASRRKTIRLTVAVFAIVLGLLDVAKIPGGIYLQLGKDAVQAVDLKGAYIGLTYAKIWRPCDTETLFKEAEAWPKEADMGPTRKLRALTKAVSCSPENPFAWIKLGEQEYDMEMYKEALKAFDGASQRFPTDKIARAWRRLAQARIFIAEKKYKQAWAEYEAVFVDYPGHPMAVAGEDELDRLEKNAVQ